jgi:hypothetical protein
MPTIDIEKGYGVAHDGRQFDPVIPPGATVSWKRLRRAVQVDEADRPASHVLAVWDRFDEMGVARDELKNTSMGPCVVFLVDETAIFGLLESPVPAPSWLRIDGPVEQILADRMSTVRDAWNAPHHAFCGPTVGPEQAWLEAAILMHHQVTGRWPIIEINVPRVLDELSFPADHLRKEADRVMATVRQQTPDVMPSSGTVTGRRCRV